MRPYRAFPAWRSPGRLPKWKPAVGPFQRRLRIEPLEDRLLLATVTTGIDFLADDGFTTLREAISETLAGGTINFAPSLFSGGPATFNLSGLGVLTINKNLSIIGPGANLLTINAFDPTPNENNGDGRRVFNINDGSAFVRVVSISGLTLTGGDTTGGGAIFNSENLTVTSSTISGNAVQFGGGGIYSGSGTSLTIASSTITGNVASLGGGISASGATVAITSSTISGNVAASYGGGVYGQASNVTLTASTVSDNTASYGGGVFSRLGSLTLTGSTVSTNWCAISGGGVFSSSADLSVKHSTITGNGADSDANATGLGGGMAIYGSGAHQLDHAIIAANTRGAGLLDDILGAAAARFSLIGDNTGATITNNGGNLIGTGAAPIDPLLGPLADYGGLMFTHALLAGSPAIDAGDASAVAGVGGVPLNDQRSAPFVRVFNGDGVGGARIDMGAYERQTVAGFNFVVDTLIDDNDGIYSPGDRSLREMIGVAQGSVGVETITFAASLTSGGPATILLTRGQLAIRDAMTIQGPGASLLTIDASGNDPTPEVNEGNGSRVLRIDDGDDGIEVSVELAGLRLTGGDDGNRYQGGAIYNREILALTASSISGNSARRGGGIENGFGELAITSSTISGNSAPWNSYSSGGGVLNYYGVLSVVNTTISGNVAFYDGGGIHNQGGAVSVVGSTISGNSAGHNGGGIGNYQNSHGSQMNTITNSTISGNSAGVQGGGVYSDTSLDLNVTTITNSTISGNSAFFGGGVSNAAGLSVIRHSTITNNTASIGKGSGIASFGYVGTRTEAHSTIIAGNTNSSVDFVVGAMNTFKSNGYNLIGSGNATGEFVEPGDQTGVANPMLGPLAANGGPTNSHALLVGSPAIDTGDPAAVAGVGNVPQFDQRGAPFTRVFNGDGAGGARIDKGAFELQPVGAALPGDYNHNNVVDAADYTLWRNTLGAVVASFSGADGDGSGTIDAADYDVWKSHFGETLPGAGSGANSASDLDEPAAPVVDVVEIDAPQANTRDSDSVYEGYLLPIASVVYRLRGVGAPQKMGDFVPAMDRSQDDLLLAVLSVTSARPRGEAIDEVAAHDADRDPPDALLAAVDRVFELL